MPQQSITIRITDSEQLLMLEVLAIKMRCKPAEVVARLIAQAHAGRSNLPKS